MFLSILLYFIVTILILLCMNHMINNILFYDIKHKNNKKDRLKLLKSFKHLKSFMTYIVIIFLNIRLLLLKNFKSLLSINFFQNYKTIVYITLLVLFNVLLIFNSKIKNKVI